jgi:hypothetical protein
MESVSKTKVNQKSTKKTFFVYNIFVRMTNKLKNNTNNTKLEMIREEVYC